MSSTLFIKGFGLNTKEADLRKIFSPFGEIDQIKISKDFTTRISRSEGFIQYHLEEDAEKARLSMNGAKLNGNVISVGPSVLPKKVVVIGGGLAGLSAAIECARVGGTGVNVLVIEKENGMYGNSSKASSGINVAMEGDVEGLIMDTVMSGKGKSDPKLVEYLVKQSQDAYDFLVEAGVDLSTVSQSGGHSAPRTRRPAPQEKPVNIGWHMMSLLNQVVANTPNISTLCNAKVSKILRKDKIVRGVECQVTIEEGAIQVLEFYCDSVILATGGFSSSRELLEQYRPDIAELATTNGAFATGDGIALAEDLDALVVDLEEVQVHPTGFVNPQDPGNKTKFLAPEALRSYGGILVNDSGKRFVDELSTRDLVSAAIGENGFKLGEESCAYLFMNDSILINFGESVFNFYMNKGLIQKFESLAEFTTEKNLDHAALVETLTVYNTSVSNGNDEFGKTRFPTAFDPEARLFVATVTPSIHYTMGGISINKYSQVLDKYKMGPIPGLYGAGEVTGGVHGKNRLAGNSLLECVVFGRLAGNQAAHYVPTLWALNKDEFVSLPLSDRIQLSSNVTMYRFGLPEGHSSGLNLGQYIAIRAVINDEEVIRYYSPISRTSEVETLDLLIKMNTNGIMTEYLDNLQIGDKIEIKGPISGLEMEVGSVQKIVMLAGGTGIAPMVQLIRAHFLHERKTGHSSDLTLLFGAKDESELVLRDLLEHHKLKHPSLTLYYTLQEAPEGWKMGTGFISEDMIKEICPGPEEDVLVVICGPPPFCTAMKNCCKAVGYSDKQVFSYL